MIEELKDFITSEINKAKRSILYDLEKKTNDIKTVIAGLNVEKDQDDNQQWITIDSQLPIESFEKFIEFEEMLKLQPEKRKALVFIYNFNTSRKNSFNIIIFQAKLFRLITIGNDNFVKDIQDIIGKTIKKSVQLLYSGAGRQVKGAGKNSFQNTETYKIMTGKYIRERNLII